MKNKPFFICLVALLFSIVAIAQKDTVKVLSYTEQGDFIKQTFVDEYDFVFLNKEPLRFLAKWNAAGALPVLNTDWKLLGGGEGISDLRLEGALEVKISPSFSVNGMFSIGFAGEKNNLLDYITLGIEPRYYINQKRRIKEGKSANNLTGTYIGILETKTTNLFKPSFWPEGAAYNWEDYNATLRIGFQQRIFKHGYIDFNWGVGAETQTNISIRTDNTVIYNRKWREHFDQKLSLGWAFGSPKIQTRENRTCDFFKCYREDSHMWKLDLLNLVHNLSLDQQSGKLSIAYEQKIRQSAFSVQVSGDFIGNHERNNNNAQLYTIAAGVSLEPRWYYSLKKRVAIGKSGNNLNGAFVGVHLSHLVSREVDNLAEFDQIYHDQSTRIIPMWGIQYRIFDRGFFEFRIGAGLSQYASNVDFRNQHPPYFIDPTPKSGIELAFLSALKIGIAF